METRNPLILNGIFGKDILCLTALMERFNLVQLMVFAEYLTRDAEAIKWFPLASEDKNKPIPDFLSTTAIGIQTRLHLNELDSYCKVQGLESTEEAIRILLGYRGRQASNLSDSILHILEIFRGEVDKRHCLCLTREEARMYNDQKPFGDKVFNYFSSPSYRNDIANASKCLALGQWDASVHLSIGVVEKAVRRLGKKLGIKPIEWGGIVDEINKQFINNWHPIKGSLKERQKDAIGKAATHLYQLNRAYRRYSAHRKTEYQENEAKKIFAVCKSSMEELAHILPLKVKLPLSP